MNDIFVWKDGEKKASEFLKKKGFKILEINYKNMFGEIDIIAKDKKEIVFVEVKSNSSDSYGTPAERVNSHKKNKIKQTAGVYLADKNLDAFCRFDVIEVQSDKIEHIVGAF